MWTITFTRNSKEYTASFTSEFQTDSPSLEAMYLIKLDNPPILQATATGPSAKLDITVPHLVYSYVAGILFNDLDVKDWGTEGDYLWPLDKTAPGAVFNSQKYVDYIRDKRVAEFYNKCHNAEDGKFCESPGAPGHEGHTTAAEAEAEAEAEADEYRGGHQPPSPQNADRLDALGAGDEATFPADVYDHPEHYSFGDGAAHRESVAVIRRVKGKPDAPVKLYRAAPEGADSINKGDWVAISKSYAEEHAAAQAPEGETWNVYEIEVQARTIHNGGNDIIEWGYWGEDKTARVVKRIKGEAFEPYTSNFAYRGTVEFHLLGQHDQDSHGNRGGGVDQELSEEEVSNRKSIETEILADRAAKGMKPLSPASLKVYVINEASRRKKEGTPEQVKVKAKGIPATSGIDQLLGKNMEMSIPKPIREPVMMVMIEIEKLHNIPEDSIPVAVKTTTSKGAHGAFYFSGDSMNERPSRIVIKPAALQNNPHPALTFAHEFAHYLDSQAGLGVLAVSANNPQATGKARGTVLPNQTPEMKKFFAAVEKSPSYKKLVDLGKNPPEGGVRQGFPKRSRYYQQRSEVFARAYAQWVATKSNNGVLKADLNGIRSTIKRDALTATSQWGDQEFDPIYDALEDVFRSKGLLK